MVLRRLGVLNYVIEVRACGDHGPGTDRLAERDQKQGEGKQRCSDGAGEDALRGRE